MCLYLGGESCSIPCQADDRIVYTSSYCIRQSVIDTGFNISPSASGQRTHRWFIIPVDTTERWDNLCSGANGALHILHNRTMIVLKRMGRCLVEQPSSTELALLHREHVVRWGRRLPFLVVGQISTYLVW